MHILDEIKKEYSVAQNLHQDSRAVFLLLGDEEYSAYCDLYKQLTCAAPAAYYGVPVLHVCKDRMIRFMFERSPCG